MRDNQQTKYVGFWQRAGAFALDYVIILFYLIAVTLLSLLINSQLSLHQWLFMDRVRAQLIGFLLVTLPITIYFVLGESSNQQATWGKQRMGLKVTDYSGNQISSWRSFARTVLKFIPWEISHTLIWEIYFLPQINSTLINYGFILVYMVIGLNVASLVMTGKHQTIYDFLAKTYVTKRG